MEPLLSSWKEIAGYLGKGVRTVQRWERTIGLPVCRPRGADRNIVFALRSELDSWMGNGKSRGRTIKTILLLTGNVEFRREAGDLLEEDGYLVIRCGNSATAQRVILDGPRFDLLICDKETLGYSSAALAHLLTNSRMEHKVLLLANVQFNPSEALSVGLFRRNILTQPFTTREVLDCVHRLLANHSMDATDAGESAAAISLESIGPITTQANPPPVLHSENEGPRNNGPDSKSSGQPEHAAEKAGVFEGYGI